MLFTPLKIKNLNLRNRAVMSPMCTYSAAGDGVATSWHLVHYATRAAGGVGAIIVEATAVEPRGRISKYDLGLWDDGQIEKLKEITETVKSLGAAIGVQLNHAGRKSFVPEPVAPSPIPYHSGSKPRELSEAEIQDIINAFRVAALRAKAAGFDFVEIHAAHGYLINQFLSPLTNARTDRYGGNEINRVRLLSETISSVREVWPEEKALSVRVSAEEHVKGGLKPEDIGRIMSNFKDQVDIINVSSGAVERTEINADPGYQLGYAAAVRKLSGIPVIAGGLIAEANMARMALESGACDLVYFGRELLRNPYFVANEAHKANIAIYQKQYRRAYE